MKSININKIGLICIRNKNLLVVHKATLDQYITPGGKIEIGETEKECLEREIKEEIGCNVTNLTYFLTFERRSRNGTVQLKCYFGKLKGKIILNPNDSIDGYLWIGRNWKQTNIKLAPILEYQIIPKLIGGELI